MRHCEHDDSLDQTPGQVNHCGGGLFVVMELQMRTLKNSMRHVVASGVLTSVGMLHSDRK